MTHTHFTIRGESIQYSTELRMIDDLSFLKDNPRIYSRVHAIDGFDDLFPQQQQEKIYKQLLREKSVKNLIPDIRRNGGLLEPIIVRHDTQEVIEGNSRLAAYRYLNSNSEDEKWKQIQCRVVSQLTADQMTALLHYIHVRGKTEWSKYDKAYFTYVQRRIEQKNFKEIAQLFSVSETTARRDVRVIEMMKENSDTAREHFSYYLTLENSPAIKRGLTENDDLRDVLFSKIKAVGSTASDQAPFTARSLRDHLPAVLKKPKILTKFIRGDIDLDQAHDRAKISDTESKMKNVRAKLSDIEQSELEALDQSSLSAVRYEVKRLKRVVKRLGDMLNKIAPQ